MKRLFLCLFTLLLAARAAQAQPAPAGPLPALHRALALARTDSTRGRLIWALSEFSDNNDSIFYFARRAIGQLERALPATQGTERRRLLRLLGGATNNLGVGYEGRGDQQRAAPLFQRGAYLRQQGGDVRGQVESLSNLGTLRQEQDDYDRALSCYQQGVQAGESVPAAHSQAAVCLSNIGDIYGRLGDQPARLRYQLRAVALLEKGGEPIILARVLGRVANTYLYSFSDTVHAEHYARRSQQLAARLPGGTTSLAWALKLRGLIRLRQHRLPSARALLLAAMAVANAKQDIHMLSLVQNDLARVEEEAGHLPLALRYAQQSAAYGQRNILADQRDAQGALARVYEKLGQPALALTHYRRFRDLQDSVANETNKRQALRADYQRQTAALQAKQAQRQAVAAAELRRQRQLTAAAAVGALLLLALAAVLFNRFRFQQRATVAITRERERSEALLRNILPADVAEELKDTGKTTARHLDRVTVLFADIVDFTQLAETLTPQQVVAALDTYFAAFDAIVGRYELEKIKTIGDAYMLAGGLGQGPGADPAAVVYAALAMLAAVAALERERAPQGLPCFALRVGLHTGPVVAGVVGVKKFAYDIWGDTVNTAARLEAAGVAGRVNISAQTHELVAARFVCTPRGRLAAKHKGDIDMFFVEQAR